GYDARLGVAAGQGDAAFLHHRDLFQREFDAEVASGDHDAVEGVDDRVEVGHGLGLLDLRDDRDAAADLVHDLVDAVDVGGVADEGQGDHVGADAGVAVPGDRGAEGPAE